MAIRTILWTTTEPLSCAPCPTSTASVIICLPALKVNYFQCPIDPVVPPEVTPVGDYPMSTINGDITNYAQIDSCSFQYTITFEDEQLIPNTVITGADIIDVICRGCLTSYIDQQAGQEIKLELIDGVYRLTSQHGCEFEFASAAAAGELLVSQITTRTAVGISGQYYDVTSLILTPGVWEITGAIDYDAVGVLFPSTSIIQAGVSITPGNSATGLVTSFNLSRDSIPVSSTALTLIVPLHTVTVVATTTYYLKGFISYIAGTPRHVATLRAKRIG